VAITHSITLSTLLLLLAGATASGSLLAGRTPLRWMLGHWIVGHWILGHWILGHWILGHWILGHWILGPSVLKQFLRRLMLSPWR
jgi:hypothetical protein